MDVAAWLRELELEQYAQAFADHDVDAQTLRMLTESDLAAIGVASVGHRRRLAEAIASLAASPSRSLAAHAATALDAEHRQLSVLYCDMVSSTALSERLDPEEYRDVIRSFHDRCVRTVVEYDGWVANFVGDCVLAYFGWPRAHEDDAERAVRTGRALLQAIAGSGVAARVGIATGSVVVGDLIRHGPAQEQSAVGLPPNLGARLLTLAEPGQMVIDEQTKQLLPVSFTLHPLGLHALKGIDAPVAAYAVGDEQRAGSRFDARSGPDLAPMVGRERELSLLLERWSLARDGEGQAVLLVGEGGIGKSRLARALLDASAGQPHWTVGWQCSPHHTSSALWPVIQRLSHAAGLGAQEPTEQALDKLEALTGQNSQAPALYAMLLGLNGSQRYGPMEMTPQMLRERTLEVMVQQLLEMAEQRPVLLMVEDAHWVDPTTLELIERVLEHIDGARVLLLITSRPDQQPKLAAHPSVTRLSLSRLSRTSVETIVTRLGGASLNAQTLAAIVARTDGVPLFVEELTKAVLETGEAAIPASLHGSLMTRLDNLPEVKEVAQIAACIGREFDQALLQAVVGRPEAVAAAIDRLAEAELVFRRGERTNPRFTFKHALVQEAAHESMLRGKRQRVHARILEVLEVERHDTPPEILAHHAELAHEADKALAYWQQAGDAALAKSAYVEAAGYFGNAIAVLARQQETPQLQSRELTLQLRRSQALAATQGNGSEATKRAFMRANQLLETAPHAASLDLHARMGLCACYNNRGELENALPMGMQALESAQADGNPESLLRAHRMVATTHFYMGNFAAARRHLELSLDLVPSAKPRELTVRFGMDPVAATYGYLAAILFIQGYAEQSEALVARVHSIGSPSLHVLDRAGASLISCTLRADGLGGRGALVAQVEEFVELATKHRLAMHGGYADVLLGCIAPRPADAIVAFERGLAKLAAAGTHSRVPFFMGRFAMALAAEGRQDDALSAIDRALDECEKTAQHWPEAELWRMRAGAALSEPRCDRAEAARCLERALALARARSARLYELRAAVGLARLWADQGQTTLALALLAPIYDDFTEGFDTTDLVEARALLNEWRSQPMDEVPQDDRSAS